jgi:hypothetical protein
MPNSLYYEIKKYCTVIPNYALAFKFAKGKNLFRFVFPRYKQDVLQIVAVCCLEWNKNGGDTKKLGNLLSREIYYFYNHVIVNYKIKKENKQNKKYKKYTPSYFNHCDVCGKKKKEYMYKSLFPGRTVCKECYKKHKRKYFDKNYCRQKYKDESYPLQC